MKLHTSGEDYLKAIYILQQEKDRVRSMDAAERMGVSKPSVSHAVKAIARTRFPPIFREYINCYPRLKQ